MSEQEEIDAGVLGRQEGECREVIEKEQEASIYDIAQGTHRGEFDDSAMGEELTRDKAPERVQAARLHCPCCHCGRALDRSAVVHLGVSYWGAGRPEACVTGRPGGPHPSRLSGASTFCCWGQMTRVFHVQFHTTPAAMPIRVVT